VAIYPGTVFLSESSDVLFRCQAMMSVPQPDHQVTLTDNSASTLVGSASTDYKVERVVHDFASPGPIEAYTKNDVKGITYVVLSEL